MASTQRFEENWALRFATLEADRLGLPLLIHHGLDPSYPYASDRVHTFVMQGARELAARAATLGLTYRFALRRTRDDDRRVVDRIASRAALVVTDLYPTAGVLDRTLRFADRVACRVVMVDSVGIAPSAEFPNEQSAAFTMRGRLLKGLDNHLEEVEDRAPRRPLKESTLASLDVEWLDLSRVDIASEVARCEIDHEVGAVAEVTGGLAAARARLEEFVHDGLDAYDERRREPSDEGGSSRMSRWLHFGMISSAEVVRAARAHAPKPALDSFLNEVVVWRELSLNFCLRRNDYMKLRAAPDWAQRSMAAHKDDEREVIYSAEAARGGNDRIRAVERLAARARAVGNDAQRGAAALGEVGAAVDAPVWRRAAHPAASQRQVRDRWPRPEWLFGNPVVLRPLRQALSGAARVGHDPPNVARSRPLEVRHEELHRAVGCSVRGPAERPAAGAVAHSLRYGWRTK